MIIGPAPFFTPCLPAADIAMVLWLRIRAVGGLRIDEAFKSPAHMAIKGRVIVHAEALRHIVRPGGHYVAKFRPFPLHRFHQIGIQAKRRTVPPFVSRASFVSMTS
jgi:hypothetical protein